jgi:hypothetical protein
MNKNGIVAETGSQGVQLILSFAFIELGTVSFYRKSPTISAMTRNVSIDENNFERCIAVYEVLP